MECKECKSKHYLAGQAFRKYICKGCNETKDYPNTAVPKYCKKCSTDFQICERCGSDLEEDGEE